MNTYNTNQLFGRYPRLYQGRNESRMSWGFCCGDGWFHLIDRLSAQIEALCDQLSQEDGLPERASPIAYEVKDLCGSLRFRVRLKNWEWGFVRVQEMIDSLISIVEEESRHTCQFCGRCYLPGANRAGHEWHSACAHCHGRISPRNK